MTSSPPRAGRREWIGLAVLILPVLVVSMDMTVLYFAVPSIAAALTPSNTEALWVIDAYGFVLAGLLIPMGSLGDRIGRRRLLLLGAALFGAASFAAAYATSPEMLIAARALQGIGGATLMPSTLALIRNMFADGKQRRTAIAAWSVALGAGAGLGPVISGLLLNNFWWGSIFLINVPIMIVLLAIAPFLVPEYSAPGSSRFDPLSAVLSLATILPTIWGIKELAANGFSVASVLAIVIGLGVGVLFIWRQSTARHPMIDLHLFSHKGFGPGLATNLITFFGLIGFGVFTSQYLIDVLGMRPLEAALWTLAAPVVATILGPTAAQMVDKVRPAYMIAAGFLLGAAGYLIMAVIPVEQNLWLVIPGTVCIGAGMGVALTIITDMVVATAPPHRAGSASAMLQTAQELGGALGIALLGSIGAAVYRNQVDANAPAGLSAQTLAEIDQTLGGAVGVASRLTGEAAQDVLTVATRSFVTALHTVAVTGAVVAVLAAIFVILKLGHIKHDPDAMPEELVDSDTTTDEVRATT